MPFGRLVHDYHEINLHFLTNGLGLGICGGVSTSCGLLVDLVVDTYYNSLLTFLHRTSSFFRDPLHSGFFLPEMSGSVQSLEG